MVFIFRADEFEGKLASSEEGRVFWAELSELKNLSTMWHFDQMVGLACSQEHSEIFLDSTDNWKPILK